MLAKLKQGVRYAQGIAGLRRDDIMLASYPKSGSTWVRFVARNYIELMDGGKDAVGFGEVDQVMPEFGVDNLRHRWPYASVPRLVKTHLAWLPLFRGKRSILVVREPRDVMVSFFHFEMALKHPRFSGTFSEFVQHPRFGLAAWFAHTKSWLVANPVIVQYADMRNDDAGTFRRLLTEIGVQYDESALVQAVERSRFDSVKKQEAQRGHPGTDDRFKKGWRFMRDGSTGTWKTNFEPQDLETYASLLEQYPDVVAACGLEP